MVVIAIVGILAALAMPSFKSLMESQRVKSTSFEMYALFNLARSEAIKRNANVTIAPVMSGATVVSLDVTSAGGALLYSKSLPKGVELDVLPTTATTVIYQRTGRTTAAGNVTFQIDVQGATTPTMHVRCITLGLSGMPSTKKGAC